MKDRIRKIMEYEQLSPSLFADKLHVGRAVISHILNGRNNPSLDVVTRILSKMDYINSDWLLTGDGNMIKSESDKETDHNNHSTVKQQHEAPDLFSQNFINTPISRVENEYRKEIDVKHSQNVVEEALKQEVIYQKAPDRKISKIIIYYNDNTFETFNADNRPL